MSPDATHAPNGTTSRRERQRLKEQAKIVEERRRAWRRRSRRGVRIGLVALMIGAPVGGFLVWLGTRTALPPTNMDRHVERSPPAHILTTPMPVEIQKHMLEHADGEGPPGVIIHYNCRKYSCPPDLVPNLTRLAEAYPRFVYLAPNPTMDARVAMTRLGEILVLKEYDPERMRQFIARAGT